MIVMARRLLKMPRRSKQLLGQKRGNARLPLLVQDVDTGLPDIRISLFVTDHCELDEALQLHHSSHLYPFHLRTSFTWSYHRYLPSGRSVLEEKHMALLQRGFLNGTTSST
jgi:hypothetical protein